MEKSQAKGIESGVMWVLGDTDLMDAWKNPKQRELKGMVAVAVAAGWSGMHGKIPSKGN